MKVVQTIINKAEYKKIDISSIHVEEVLLFDVFIKRQNDYIIIIEAGTLLSKKLYERLQKQEALYLLKKDLSKQKLTYKTLYTYIKYNKNNLEKCLEYIYDVNKQFFNEYMDSTDNVIKTPMVEEIVKCIIYLVNDNPNFLKEMIPHLTDKNELETHFLHVSIYAICLGHFLKFKDEKLKQLGIAGLLHDVGIKNIDTNIVNKDSELEPKELEIMQKHSINSFNIAMRNHIHNPYILDGIKHHHEAYDGTGYPDHLKGEDISEFASVLSISDVFDALTSCRTYRKKYSTFDALKIMMREEGMVNKFNQVYLKVFLKSFIK